MKLKNILISQPSPINGSPYTEITTKYGVNVDFLPFFKIETIEARDFRSQKINILDHSAIVFTARTTIDAFFHICEETRVVIPETMKYFCSSEAVAFYLSRHITYRKRKIFFGDGTTESIINIISKKHQKEKFLIATTDNAKPDVVKIFTKAKLQFDNAVFCRTIISDLSKLDLKKYQLLVFYSPSDVKSLLDNFPEFEQKDLMFATFGSNTAKAMKAAKLHTEITAPTPEAPSIANALLLYMEKSK